MGRHLLDEGHDKIVISVNAAIQSKNWQALEGVLNDPKLRKSMSPTTCRALFDALAGCDNEKSTDDEISKRKKLIDLVLAMKLDHVFLKSVVNHTIWLAGNCQMQRAMYSIGLLSAERSVRYYLLSQILKKYMRENYVGNLDDSIEGTYEIRQYSSQGSKLRLGLEEFEALLKKANAFFVGKPADKFKILSKEFAQKLKSFSEGFEKSNDVNERKVLRKQALSELLQHLKICIKADCLPRSFSFKGLKREPVFSDLPQPKRPGFFATIARLITKIFYTSLAEKIILALDNSHSKGSLVEEELNRIRYAYGAALTSVKNISNQIKGTMLYSASPTMLSISSASSTHSLSSILSNASMHSSPSVSRTNSVSSDCRYSESGEAEKESYNSPGSRR